MKCLVVTPEKTVLSVDAISIVLPLVDGEYGVMAGHTPVVARLGAGELRIQKPNNEPLTYYVEGGFVEILDDVVSLLSMHAMPAEELDIQRAEEQLDEAIKRPANTPELAQIRDEKLASRRARLRVAKKYSTQ